jgi:hypothetical protein
VGKIKFLYMSDDSIVIQSWKETLGTWFQQIQPKGNIVQKNNAYF